MVYEQEQVEVWAALVVMAWAIPLPRPVKEIATQEGESVPPQKLKEI